MWPKSSLSFNPDQPADLTIWVSCYAADLNKGAFLEDLSSAEMERLHALTLPKRHREYATARSMQRAALSVATGIPPARLAFGKGKHGKPSHPQVEFNISHCRGLVICAVGKDEALGLDCEPLNRGDQVMEVAKRVFTSDEQAALAALPPEQRKLAALELWTLKEAVIKAIGRGLTLEPSTFGLKPGASGGIKIDHSTEADLSGWQLELFHLKDAHSIALCHRTGRTPNVVFRDYPTPFDLSS